MGNSHVRGDSLEALFIQSFHQVKDAAVAIIIAEVNLHDRGIKLVRFRLNLQCR